MFDVNGLGRPPATCTEEAMIKLLYKPLHLAVSVLAGMLAGAVFKQAWRLVAREDEAPHATDVRKGWREILLASALQGAIFAVVKAAVDRGTAEGTRKLTGVWPGEDSEPGEGQVAREGRGKAGNAA
jgi:Protein of unknown function (DUF4235)